jgi:uncharacterized protein DUF1905/bacteriocin resistance YdeI/OmpD-like protein
MTAVAFTTIAQPNPGGVLFVEIPASVVKKLGAGKRVPVRVTLNGAKYRSTIAVYGGRYYLPARKEVRDAAKLVAGGRARVSLEVDTAPRTVRVPADLARALSAANVRPHFDAFSFSHRKEFAEWVTSAKRPETRAARIPKVVAQVRAKARAASTPKRSTEGLIS